MGAGDRGNLVHLIVYPTSILGRWFQRMRCNCEPARTSRGRLGANGLDLGVSAGDVQRRRSSARRQASAHLALTTDVAQRGTRRDRRGIVHRGSSLAPAGARV
jgi:hypothetical protein